MTTFATELSRDEILSVVAVLTVVIDMSKENEDKMTDSEKKERQVCIGVRDKLFTMLMVVKKEEEKKK